MKNRYEDSELIVHFFAYLNIGFAKTKNAKSTPRVRFEAISVGVALALREKPDLVPSSMEWLNSEAFKIHATTHASNSPKRVSGSVDRNYANCQHCSFTMRGLFIE